MFVLKTLQALNILLKSAAGPKIGAAVKVPTTLEQPQNAPLKLFQVPVPQLAIDNNLSLSPVLAKLIEGKVPVIETV
jgi:hypothetical protein